MENYVQCQEYWFKIDLKCGVCYLCFLQDKDRLTPFLMSAENDIDPGDIPGYLPELTQLEEIIIACSHMQMIVY